MYSTIKARLVEEIVEVKLGSLVPRTTAERHDLLDRLFVMRRELWKKSIPILLETKRQAELLRASRTAGGKHSISAIPMGAVEASMLVSDPLTEKGIPSV